MVNLTTIAQGRKPLLIYGVKRGKVPTKLRPHMVPKPRTLGEGSCMNEMFKLMACWNSNGFIDTHCQEEISLFLDCLSSQTGTQKSSSAWTIEEINATLKRHTPHIKKRQSHEFDTYTGEKTD
ncbi:coiled-coil-helix-coiled-coil-helix domain-containing protein 1-like [Stylophora pistillata]|uniref:Coiled-coil-helix-coiled-coil-helix domain-containing protein 1 n=1 Tax=Stylophora pistillata TaxID=50429 RepID=A0A2B4SXQ5_STYPI|nr:coiled-coil-helix-coiled-coil-helix domain-containing protein 1-like [Stylophora pistillata]PFX34096.1 Coiled-coil-helix-coiled-coil-helix domain-containing protein 1 [Stylophora pistillata]